MYGGLFRGTQLLMNKDYEAADANRVQAQHFAKQIARRQDESRRLRVELREARERARALQGKTLSALAQLQKVHSDTHARMHSRRQTHSDTLTMLNCGACIR